MSRALSGALPRPTRARNASRPMVAASGPDAVEVGVQPHAAEPALVAQREAPAVLELQR